ncbi:MAG TPA: helix-turn-helix domain-containing protein [Cyclobacteriaceae bacterium]|nr:helix-turn-helix domain-containing protein [Cyclobacteriaceae bacterium]
MGYREYLPHPALRTIVECYWSVRGRADSFWTVYPDAAMDILFNFGSFIETRNEAGSELAKNTAFVIGNMFVPIQSRTVGDTDLFGIRFRAAGMARILRIPLHEFNDESLPLESVYKLAPEAEQLQTLSQQERVNFLDRWLLKRISFSSSKPEAWEYCLNNIVERGGNVNVYDLSREVGISQKQMERKFVEKVGPTPKQFAQLLKFRKLRERLEKKDDESLMNVAFDFEFVDHSHLSKFFRKFAGLSPTEFLKR